MAPQPHTPHTPTSVVVSTPDGPVVLSSADLAATGAAAAAFPPVSVNGPPPPPPVTTAGHDHYRFVRLGFLRFWVFFTLYFKATRLSG